MADGFALRGFTQGFTQGLQNIDQLATNWQARDLKQKGYELEQQQQERANRYNDYLIQNMKRDNARLDRQQQVNEQSAGLDMEGKRNNLQAERMKIEQAQKQADLVRINDALTVGKVDDDTWGLMRKYGFDGFVGTDPSQLNQIADDIESGRRPPNDPEVMKVLNPVLTPAAMRNIGGEGVVPNTVYQNTENPAQNLPRPGTPVRVATKKVVGYDQVNGKWVPRLQVQGADKHGNFVSYEAPFTQRASSDPDDPLMPMSQQDLANKLRGAAYVNQRLKADPTLQERLKGQVQDVYQGIRGPVSPKDQAYVMNQQDQVRSRQFQDKLKAYETDANIAADNELAALRKWQQKDGDEKRKALVEYEAAKKANKEAQTRLYDAKTQTESSIQDRNYAAADYSDSRAKGLGSVGKPGKKPAFKQKDVMERAKALYRSESGDMPGMPVAPEVEQRRFKFFNDVQTLVVDAGVDQDKAMHWVQNNPREIRKRASDGRQFEAVVVKGDDGKNQYFPVKWLD